MHCRMYFARLASLTAPKPCSSNHPQRSTCVGAHSTSPATPTTLFVRTPDIQRIWVLVRLPMQLLPPYSPTFVIWGHSFDLHATPTTSFGHMSRRSMYMGACSTSHHSMPDIRCTWAPMTVCLCTWARVGSVRLLVEK